MTIPGPCLCLRCSHLQFGRRVADLGCFIWSDSNDGDRSVCSFFFFKHSDLNEKGPRVIEFQHKRPRRVKIYVFTGGHIIPGSLKRGETSISFIAIYRFFFSAPFQAPPSF
uniref:Uncharacterized protein n=1 Tax=Micrurus spixii TaxID=129469 RepID=A0A2D4LGT6_9SAUR